MDLAGVLVQLVRWKELIIWRLGSWLASVSSSWWIVIMRYFYSFGNLWYAGNILYVDPVELLMIDICESCSMFVCLVC